MTVFCCATCGTELTGDLSELPSVPDFDQGVHLRDPKTRIAAPTMPAGHYAIEPEPWGAPYVPRPDPDEGAPAQPRGNWCCGDEGFLMSAGTRGNVVLDPADAPTLQPLPDRVDSYGCCGPTGDRGLNRACPCGAAVATLMADCYTPCELHLDPAGIRARG